MNDSTHTEDNASADGDWAAALEEQAASEGTTASEGTAATGDGAGGQARQAAPDAGVDRAQFEELDSEPVAAGDGNLDVVLDIPVTISMETGRTRINIRNLLQLNQGSVVELDRIAGEPMDVLVNGTLIAHGEVVVVNERLGIRLTDVISPSERIRKLR
ncbi:MAG TPA: flagellar motor switch protein FliN [Gammaproteobacteria bacterium]|nr:flagellar motor switch protein FliN [bacterium BMS3Abin12]HDK03621.1 flagellar motor switch protein FliN [Gammaproteobacteria bacterium]